MPRILEVFAEYRTEFTKLDIQGRRLVLATPIDQIASQSLHKAAGTNTDGYLANTGGKLGTPIEVTPLGYRKYKLMAKQICYWSNRGLPSSPCRLRVWIQVSAWQPALHWLLNPIDQDSIEYWLLVANRLCLDRNVAHQVAVWIYKGRCHLRK